MDDELRRLAVEYRRDDEAYGVTSAAYAERRGPSDLGPSELRTAHDVADAAICRAIHVLCEAIAARGADAAWIDGALYVVKRPPYGPADPGEIRVLSAGDIAPSRDDLTDLADEYRGAEQDYEAAWLAFEKL